MSASSGSSIANLQIKCTKRAAFAARRSSGAVDCTQSVRGESNVLQQHSSSRYYICTPEFIFRKRERMLHVAAQ